LLSGKTPKAINTIPEAKKICASGVFF